jgi:hypothetical protein
MYTGRADSKKEYLMPFCYKAWQSSLPFVQGASLYLKETVACMTMEMMVVFIRHSFIKDAQLRVVDDPQPPNLNEGFKVSIHSRLVEGFHRFPAHLQDLINPKRSICKQKSLLNRILLNGFSSHIHPL